MCDTLNDFTHDYSHYETVIYLGSWSLAKKEDLGSWKIRAFQFPLVWW